MIVGRRGGRAEPEVRPAYRLSGTGLVEAFDCDGFTGAISGRRTLVHIDQRGIAPDGLTVNEQGDIWVALYGGWASTATGLKARCEPLCTFPWRRRRRARSAETTAASCLSPQAANGSRKPSWGASRMPGGCSRSLAWALVGLSALRTAARSRPRGCSSDPCSQRGADRRGSGAGDHHRSRRRRRSAGRRPGAGWDPLRRDNLPHPGCSGRDRPNAQRSPADDGRSGHRTDPRAGGSGSESGAQYLVSPAFDAAVVDWCEAHSVPIIPGVATPSEVNVAWQRGLRTLKLFPAEQLGGVALLRALHVEAIAGV
jgi:hypothetical protein